jgi:hypothetical protein
MMVRLSFSNYFLLQARVMRGRMIKLRTDVVLFRYDCFVFLIQTMVKGVFMRTSGKTFLFFKGVFLCLGCCSQVMNAGHDDRLKVATFVTKGDVPIVKREENTISVIRPATPSLTPEKYCDLIKDAILQATGKPGHRTPERSSTPLDIDFGESLIAACKQVESGENSDGWKSSLEQLMAILITSRSIERVQVRINSLQSVSIASALVGPAINPWGTGSRIKRLSIEYNDNNSAS